MAEAAQLARAMKIVVTGPFDAGKTSLINTISETAVVSTERSVTGGSGAKRETTVAMDFGRISIDRDLALYLFGTPGQRRFDFMWDILSEGMLGFIVIVDPSRDEAIEEAKEILAYFRDAAAVPYVVAVNKVQGNADQVVTQTRAQLGLAPEVRTVVCNALDKVSVKSVLLELLYAVLDDIEAEAGTAAAASA